MRHVLLAVVALLAALSASAATYYEFTGTLAVLDSSPRFLPSSLSASGSGIGVSSRVPVNEIRGFAGVTGFTGTATSTDFIATGGFVLSQSARVEGIGDGTFTGAGGPLHGPLPVQGNFLSQWAPSGTTVDRFPFTTMGTAGLGLGGVVPGSSAPVTFGTWTTGLVTVAVSTGSYHNPNPALLAAQGYDHRTPSGMGAVRLVTPARTVTTTFGGWQQRGAIVALTLHFAPEPARGLALFAGGVALALLAFRSASRKRSSARR